MSLDAKTLLLGASAATYTGGTSNTLRSLGVQNGAHRLFLDDGTSVPLNQRLEVSFSVKEPKVSEGAPNGYTQARTVVMVKYPMVLDNGNLTVNTISINVATDIETSDAERDELLLLAAQIINNSDFRAAFDDLAVG